ncbi:ran GTPase-activating protein 1-like [Oscarella lobularis]|uniref:ran GTPase-activating protein 1-like n=1 Tax=Oscarella lobularis TaxID=121494 RepID=UPI0033141994
MAHEDPLRQFLRLPDVPRELSVDFSGRSLKLNGAEDAEPIAKAIKEHDGLTLLRLSGNTIGVEASAVIAEALESKPSLKFSLLSDMYTGRLRSEIPPSLNHLGGAMIRSGCRLVELDLSDNAFGPDGVRACLDLLASSAAYSLQILKFNNNGLGIGGGKLLAQGLIDCHRNASGAGETFALAAFVSGRNRLENEGAIALAEAFRIIGSLVYVSMPQNGICAKGISALSDALTYNEGLRHLNLNDNTFTESGAQAMAKNLSQLQNLEIINFGDCLMKSAGCRALANSLKESHAKLKELYLPFNEVNKEAALDLVRSLAGKPDLRQLHLNGNQLGEDGIREIRDAVEDLGLSTKDILDSMSDDEGEESDEEEEKENDDVNAKDPNLNTSSALPQVKKNVREFLQKPSAEYLMDLGSNRADLFKAELGDECLANPRNAVSAFCTVSSVIAKDTSTEVIEAVNKISDVLLEPCFCLKPELMAVEILVHLGLLKSEDKMKPVSNVYGPLVLLKHIIREDYCPKSVIDTLTAFMSKPNPSLVAVQSEIQDLLQALQNVNRR